MIASNLNWSFPFPVQPCAIAVAPSFSATSISFRAINGLAKAVLNGYPSYSAFALIPRAMYRSEERRVGKECRSRWSPYH